MKTIFFIGGSLSESNYYLREHILGNGGFWVHILKMNKAYCKAKDTAIIALGSNIKFLLGYKDFEIVKCGNWYKLPTKTLRLIEFIEKGKQ